MAGDWIKVLTSLPTSGKIVRISSACDEDILRTLGGCVSALCLADLHAEPRGDEGWMDGYTPEALDRLVGITGLTRAMESAGWVRVEPQAVVFLEFTKHNGTSAKRRAMDAARQHRVRKMSACDADEKRTREEKSKAEQTRQEETKASCIAPESPTQAALLALHECGVNGRNAAALVDGGVTAEEVQSTWASIRLNPKATNKQGVLVDALRKAHGVRLPKKRDGLTAGEAEAVRRIEQLARLRVAP